MLNEPWWKQSNDDDDKNNNLRSMLLYLIDILKSKQIDSYESACTYVVDIFRNYGIEPILIDQILSILLVHLTEAGNNPLDVYTIRTIAQFMIERKPIVIALLDCILKCQPEDALRQEAINAVKFITDVNGTDDIELALKNMSVVRDAFDETFSLKMIIERLKSQIKPVSIDLVDENEEKKEGEEEEKEDKEELHPLLKKISDERWFPRDSQPITLDYVLDAIIVKLPNASKTMLKTLTNHLVQLSRTLALTNEQFARVAHGLISLLSHTDADHRLLVATILMELGKETKAIDLALLKSFLNDTRVLVRTECCDTLKKLTGIMSETVLKDCADDIPYLETLPEEGFSLQNYLKEKNRQPTPPPPPPSDEPVEEKSDEEKQEETVPIEEEKTVRIEEENQEKTVPIEEEEQKTVPIEKEEKKKIEMINEDRIPSPLANQADEDEHIPIRSVSPSLPLDKQPSITTSSRPLPTEFDRFNTTHTVVSSTVAAATPLQPAIRVEISEKPKPIEAQIPPVPQLRRESPLPIVPTRQRKLIPISSEPPPPPPPVSQRTTRMTTRPVISNRSSRKKPRGHLLPDNSEMWDSYAKQPEIEEQQQKPTDYQDVESLHVPQLSTIKHPTEPQHDVIQSILDEHTRHVGYYRMQPNRRVLIPHKISMDDLFSDQMHMINEPLTTSTWPTTGTLHLSDSNRNRRHLHEVEFVQLLSSLIIRAVQIHRQYERLIPGPATSLAMGNYAQFTDALNISQMQLHTMSTGNVLSHSFSSLTKLPPILSVRPSSAQMLRMQSDAHTAAARAGIDVSKAQDLEDVLSTLLKNDRELTKSILAPAVSPSSPFVDHVSQQINQNDVTHAWLLEQLLKSSGTPDAQECVQRIARSYPKFLPLLHSRIPSQLISTIWTDPVMKQLAYIVGNRQDGSSVTDLSTRRTDTRPSMPAFDDEHSSNFFDYTAPAHLTAMQQQNRDEHKKKFLPPLRGTKMRLPRHVLKFGFREIDIDPPEATIESLRDGNTPKSRRRRIYMHLMECNHNHSN